LRPRRPLGEPEAIDMAHLGESVTIKRYAKERLYQPAAGRYVTLLDLAQMIEDEEDFVVYEVPTGEDITRSILRQIILERAKHG
jgi:polyhydroxyalkanoate synthesis repressor PhaR